MSSILSIGDIHCKTWIIDEVEKLIDDYDHIVFVGDYADNWNTPPIHSMATWRLLRQFMQSNPDKVHAVIGNHDFAYVHPEIAGRSSGWSPVTFTLINTPENKKIKDWLLSLPVTLELDGVTFSHAGITNEWNGKEDVWNLWQDNSPIWARPREMGGNITYKDIPQVIGHNSSKEIWNPAPNVWCIDVFSEDQQNNFIGDKTVLKIINGKEFHKIKLNDITNENNNNTSGVEDEVS